MKKIKKIGIVIISIMAIIIVSLSVVNSSYTRSVGAKRQTNYFNKKYIKEEFENVTIKYTEKQKPCIDKVKEFIKNSKSKVKKVFKEEEIGRVTIILHDNEEEFKNGIDSENIAGYYDGANKTINLYVKDPLLDVLINSSFESVLIHEYTHHAIREVARKNGRVYRKIPVWFNEGLSEFIAKDGYNIYEVEDHIDFDKICKDEGWNEYVDKYDLYNQSYLGVNRIIEDFNIDSIEKIIKKLQNKNFDKAFEDVTKKSFYEFEKEIKTFNVDSKIFVPEIDIEERLKVILNYLKVDKNHENAYVIASNIYLNYFNDTKNSIKILEEGIKNIESKILLRDLGIKYEMLGKEELAKEAFKKAKKLE